MSDLGDWVSRRWATSTLFRGLVIFAGLFLAAAVLGAIREQDGGSGDLDRDLDELTRSVTPRTVSVLYEVEGSVPYASVTIATPDGIEQIEPDVPLVTQSGSRGLQYQYDSGSALSISAQKTAGSGSGTITCRITVDGTVIAENTSTAPFGVAACSGAAIP